MDLSSIPKEDGLFCIFVFEEPETFYTMRNDKFERIAQTSSLPPVYDPTLQNENGQGLTNFDPRRSFYRGFFRINKNDTVSTFCTRVFRTFLRTAACRRFWG